MKKNKIKFLTFLKLVLVICFLSACQDFNPESVPTDPSDQDGETLDPLFINLNFCDALSTNLNGRLCAIQPSKTDSSIRNFAFNNIDRPGPGFGYHVVGVPNDLNSIKGVWLHFVGSYGTPFVPGGQNAGVFGTRTWVNELVKEGYLVVSLAYDNQESVNGDLCGIDDTGYDVDNCAGDVRREIIEGVNHSSEIVVNFSDGVNNRFNKLLAYLSSHGFNLSDFYIGTAVDWSKIRVSGHSQGAGHAYYLAKNVGVKSACFLGGPYDTQDSVNPAAERIADWYLTPNSLTPIANMSAFLVTSDTNYISFIGAYSIIGLVKNTHWFEASGSFTNDLGEPIDGHGASVSAPALESNRANACF